MRIRNYFIFVAYLKESRPLALSRKRDAWLLLIGAASAGVILLILVLTGLILAAKKKRAHSAAVAPPNRSILKKEREYAATTPGLDNAAFSTSETEIKVLNMIFLFLYIYQNKKEIIFYIKCINLYVCILNIS